MSEATRLLEAVRNGEARAVEELLPVVYQELRRLARSQMAQECPGHTFEATALVHEAFLRLVQDESRNWDGRRHFFAAAAEAMRRILVEHARRKHALKNGGGRQRVELDDELPAISAPCDSVEDLLSLNEALERLAVEDPGKAELIKLLFFTGLSLDEAARALGLSRSTAYRHWLFARAWLFHAMNGKACSAGEEVGGQ